MLYVIAAAVSCQNAPVTEENPGEDGSPIIEFSDPKFLEALLRPCIPYPDMNGDGRISEKEAASIFAISCNSFEIKDISEIRYFTNLEQLYCHENLLADLDLSHNPKIEILVCSDNVLQEIDPGLCPAMTYLMCNGNSLSALDLAQNPALQFVDCSDNPIETLALTPSVTYLNCGRNRLQHLDLEGISVMSHLHCPGNCLTDLDLGGMQSVASLDCSGNMLYSLNIGSSDIGFLNCAGNNISDLDIDSCVSLMELDCHGNRLTTLDLSGKLCILKVNCSDNPLEKVILPSGHFKDYTIVEQIAESIREEYGDIVEYR